MDAVLLDGGDIAAVHSVPLPFLTIRSYTKRPNIAQPYLEFPRSALQFHLDKVLRAQMLGALQQWHQEPRSLIRTDMLSVFVMDMETRWQEYSIDWDNELRVVNMMIDRTLSDVCDLDSFAKQQVAIWEIDVEAQALGNLHLRMGYQSEWVFNRQTRLPAGFDLLTLLRC